MISIQAPQYRQHALISDFLDFANLSIKEEAALATNWIKGRPEGLKLLCDRPSDEQLPKNMTADVQSQTNASL